MTLVVGKTFNCVYNSKAERLFPTPFRPGYPKVGQVAPLGAKNSKGLRGGLKTVKEPYGGYKVINFLKLTLDILKLQMKSKKEKRLWCF